MILLTLAFQPKPTVSLQGFWRKLHTVCWHRSTQINKPHAKDFKTIKSVKLGIQIILYTFSFLDHLLCKPALSYKVHSTAKWK